MRWQYVYIFNQLSSKSGHFSPSQQTPILLTLKKFSKFLLIYFTWLPFSCHLLFWLIQHCLLWVWATIHHCSWWSNHKHGAFWLPAAQVNPGTLVHPWVAWTVPGGHGLWVARMARELRCLQLQAAAFCRQEVTIRQMSLQSCPCFFLSSGLCL